MMIFRILLHELQMSSSVLVISLAVSLPSVWLTLQFARNTVPLGLVIIMSSTAIVLFYLIHTYYYNGRRERLYSTLPVPRGVLYWIPVLYLNVTSLILMVFYASALAVVNALVPSPSSTLTLVELIGYGMLAYTFVCYYLLQASLELYLAERLRPIWAMIFSVIPSLSIAAFIILFALGVGSLEPFRDVAVTLFQTGELSLYLLAASAIMLLLHRLMFVTRKEFGRPTSSDAFLLMMRGGN